MSPPTKSLPQSHPRQRATLSGLLVTTPNSFLRDSSPANKPPRLSPAAVDVLQGNPPVRSASLKVLGGVPHTDGRGGRLGLRRGGGEGGRAEDDDLVPEGAGREKGLVADLVVEASGGEEVPKRQGGRVRGTWWGLWDRGTWWRGFREGEGLHICG